MLRSLLHIILFSCILLSAGLNHAASASHGEYPVVFGGYPIPEGFLAEVLTRSESPLSSLAFAPDGSVFLAEKAGRIWRWKEETGILSLQLDLSSEVYANGRRGIESMVIEPNGSNARLFILYAVSDVEDGNESGAFGRIARYELGNTSLDILETTREVLLGDSYSNGIPVCGATNEVGRIRLGADGSLLIATGDGASRSAFDDGGLHQTCFGAGRLGNEEDIGAYRAQSLTSLSGKVLRIDPNTGNGLPSNPFFTGSSTSTASKIWAYGLREPAGLLARPEQSGVDHPGTIWVGDRGWGVLQELHVSNEGGFNLGWPCVDGVEPVDEYQEGSLGNIYCASTSSISPLYWWHHQNAAFSNPSGLSGSHLNSLTFNEGDKYPSYKNRFFYSDKNRGWLASSALNESGQLVDQQLFSVQAGTVQDMQYNPFDEYMYYIDQRNSTLVRLRHRDELAVYELDNNPRSVEVAGRGAFGEYFDDVDFTGGTVTRIDSLLDYSRFLGPDGDTYNAARWEGYIIPSFDEVYTIHVSYLEQVRFWMNDELLIEHASEEQHDEGQHLTERLFVALKAGVPYRIKMEQALRNEEVKVGLAWSSASQPFEVLSVDQVFYTIREGVNLCLLESAYAIQSSTLSPFAGAENACDGITNGDYLAGSVAATENQVQPYWEVDLGAERDIEAITIWGRTDCCEETLGGAFIFVSDDPFEEESLGVLSQPGVSTYIIPEVENARFESFIARTGRYIRVQHPTEPVLYLAEVEIHAGIGNLEGALPVDGLISWWPFENGAEDRRGRNDGKLQNGARIDQDGSRQGVLLLDGNSDWMEVPHADQLNGIQALTYALWIHPEQWQNDAVLIGKGDSGTGQMWLGVEDNQLVGRVDYNEMKQEVRTATPAEGVWSHIALVFDGNEMRLYVNGRERDEQAFAFNTLQLNEESIIVGLDVEGRLDDVVIYNTALNETQLQELQGALSNVSIEEEASMPGRELSFALNGVYPTPFTGRVNLQYTVSHSQDVHIDIYDSIGRRVRTLPVQNAVAGTFTLMWDGLDDWGRDARAGVYFVRFTSGGSSLTAHLIKL